MSEDKILGTESENVDTAKDIESEISDCLMIRMVRIGIETIQTMIR